MTRIQNDPPDTPDDDVTMSGEPLMQRHADMESSDGAYHPREPGEGRRPISTLDVAFRVLVSVAAAVLFGLLIRSSISAHEKNAALWTRCEALNAECRRLEERRAGLARESFALENDPFYIEKRIRQDWRQLRKGEVILERPKRR